MNTNESSLFMVLCGGALLSVLICTASTAAGQSTAEADATAPAPQRATDTAEKKGYSSRFSEALDPWEPVAVERAPSGSRVFLGTFVDEPVSLTLNDLPPHDYLRLSFDLLTLMTWDGSGDYSGPGPNAVGPDFFRVWVDDGPLLMRQSFSNIPKAPGFRVSTTYQSYPSPVPGDLVSSQTGAVERQTLGYLYDAGPGFIMDAVYRVEVLFPHRGNRVQINFAAPNLQRIEAQEGMPDEMWGLDNVRVEPVSADAIEHPDAQRSRALLETAADRDDPFAARQAYLELLTGGPETREVLRDAREQAGVDWSEVDRLLSELKSDDAVARASARVPLIKLGAVVEMPLRTAAASTYSDPFRAEIEAVLDEILTKPIDSDRHRRAAVANRVLHIIGEE